MTDAPLLGEPLPIELINTVWADRDGVHDALASTPETHSWLRAVAVREDAPPGLAEWLGSVTGVELARAHGDLLSLRDAARRLAQRRTDDLRQAGQVPLGAPEALTTLNALAARARTWPALEWPDDGPPQARLVSEADAVSGLVAEVAGATIAVLSGESGRELRACLAPGCVLYFLRQHPRREWCSDACGNRARQARHYRRHHPPG